MSMDVRKTDDGCAIILPLELPVVEGSVQTLGQQAEVCLASLLRHSAICDWIQANLNMESQDVLECYEQEHAQAVSQLSAAFMTLAGIAVELNADVMHDIWNAPWEV